MTRSEEVMAVDTSTHNLLVGLAAIEARQSTFSEQLEDLGERNIERFEALVDRLDERHKALLERIETRERHITEALERLSTALPPIVARVEELERAKTRLLAIGTGGGILTTAAAWAIEVLTRQ